MEYRTLRQTILILVPILVFLLIAFFVYYKVRPSPTCFDTVRNHGEEGTDCGGPCADCALKTKQPLQVFYVRFGQFGKDRYDIVAEVRNPNIKLSAVRFSYEVTLRDKSGFVIKKIRGSSYIYPLETVHVVEAGISLSRPLATAELKILDNDVAWVVQDVNVFDLIGGDKEVEQQTNHDGSVITLLNAKIFNRSILDVGNVDVAVLVSDEHQNVVAISKTVISKIKGGDFAPVTFSWSGDLPIDINRVMIEPRVNVLK
ncbi:MAG: hypothetical protein HYW88_02855 [Candidatus Sungbacteria bacterium]|nr:hypothetical protein [Candidatus Sungbacteria bacterium]